MKKIKYLILLALCVFTIAISSCKKKPTKCEHISSEWIIDQQATCTTTGSKHTECTKCHEKLETDVVEALGHNIVHYEKKEATCKEAGNEAYDACSRCDYTTYIEIKKLDHEIEHHEGLEATCTKSGYKAYDTCKNCDYTTHEAIAALDHEIEHHEGLEATCTAPGYKAYDTCSRCDYTTYVEIKKLDHEIEHHEGLEATCTAPGYKAYDTCKNCDYTTYVEIKKLDHEIEHHEGLEATCTAPGYKAYDTCKNCDYTTYEVIVALDHDIVHHEGLEATCTESGYKAYDTCSRCDYTTYEEILALNHNYEGGVCTKCGQKEPKKEYIIEGNYVYLGYYPQTLKDDSVTITSDTPDSDGYYLGSDGERYAKVEAKPNSSTYYFSNNQQIVKGTTYYFKVEPIKWKILQVNGTEYKLVTDLIIDNQMFHSSTDARTIDGKTIYANNYEYSDIRKWLNEDFYNKAFTKALQSCINTTLVDNSIESTGESSNQYICNDTYDKVYLLSVKEMKNEEYGFTNDTSISVSRQKQLTDYAKALGCSMSKDDSYYNNGYYWLRSPRNHNNYDVDYINEKGVIWYDWCIKSRLGVCPAITINLG